MGDDGVLGGIFARGGAERAVDDAALLTITLAPGDSVVCTYSDRRIEPPVPPEPPTPPPGPTPPSPTPLSPPPPPTTLLRVVKTAPLTARVGQRMRFKLTVTNMGSGAARNVLLVDVPPAAVRLARLRTRTRAGWTTPFGASGRSPPERDAWFAEPWPSRPARRGLSGTWSQRPP